MAEPLNIFTIWPWGTTASFYYRLGVPLLTARDLGLPIKVTIDRNGVTEDPQKRIIAMCDADLCLFYQPVGELAISNMRAMQSFIPSKRDGAWKWPPSVILESDDNLFNVSPLNQAFKNLGVKDMNGELIPLGHHIGVMQDGERKVLWKDGENGFSLLKNRQQVAGWKRLIEMADAVTVSTPEVKKSIEKDATPYRCEVFPNMVRFQDYEQVDLVKDPNKINILWQGGNAHYEDWYPLREALGNITKKYPQVHWTIWGAIFPWVKELIPSHRYTYKSWCHYEEYKLRLAMVGHDINLAPLTDHVFNRCRSAIKWYESSVLKHPAATLAQNTGAYKAEIEDGETALLFNDPAEFEQKLSLLIENETERKRIAGNAKDWVNENRNAMREVPKWVQFWEQMREERKTEQPHPTDEHFDEIEAEALAEDSQLVGA